MTLSISLWDHNKGPYSLVPAPEIDGWSAAGFENWRKQVYGSQPFRDLGLRFFPQLADGDLHVPPVDLPAFANECRSVLRAPDELAIAVKLNPVDLRCRMLQFLAVVELASLRGSGVEIA